MKYKFKIEHPCDQSWEEMIPTQGGKHCIHCSKTVIDFTSLSDGEILKIVQNAKTGICGRLREDQHNRTLIVEKQASSLRLTFSKIAASLLLIGASETAGAQVRKYETRAATVTTPTKEKATAKPVVKKKLNSPTKKIIRGQVRDSLSNSVVPSATVFLKGANISVQTDKDGHFQLVVPGKLLKNNLTLIVAAEWYINRAFLISKEEFDLEKEFLIVARETLTVEAKGISFEKRAIGGGMIAEIVEDDKNTFKRKWWQFWKKKIQTVDSE